MDEDGSGCLTAADLKVEPLGLKPSCGASDVARKAFEWQRACCAALGQPSPRRPSASPAAGKSPGGSLLGRQSFGAAAGAAKPPRRAATLSGPDVDALLAAAALDGFGPGLEPDQVGVRSPQAPAPAAAAAATSPRSTDRFVVVEAQAAKQRAAHDGDGDETAGEAFVQALEVAVLAVDVEESGSQVASRSASQPGSRRHSRPGSRKPSPNGLTASSRRVSEAASSSRASYTPRGSKTPPKARYRTPPKARATPPAIDADALAAAASAGPLV
jgi:hypothetical protein